MPVNDLELGLGWDPGVGACMTTAALPVGCWLVELAGRSVSRWASSGQSGRKGGQ